MTEITKNSQQLIKESHLKLVFSLIHEIDGISRADIKKLTKLSATTVSALVDELISMGFVVETGMKDASTSGRKAISLSVNGNGGHFAVVTVSGHHLRLRIYNFLFELLVSDKCRYDVSRKLSLQLLDFLKKNLSAVKDCGELLGITVGVPAIIDADFNILSSTVLTVDSEDRIFSVLDNAFPNTNVLLCDTSGLMAYAEKEFGDTDAQNLVAVDISDGVGAAVTIDGALYTGSGGMAGEFGHVSVDLCGEKCRCGSRGCLETLISIPAILKRASSITGEEMTLEMLSESVHQNNELAALMEKTAQILAYGINNLINIIDPDAVVICGDLKILEKAIMSTLPAVLDEISLPGRDIPVVFTTLDNDAQYLGGAKYAFDALFK